MKRAVDDVARAFIAAASVVAILFLLLPVAMSVIMSFDSRGYLGPFPPPGFSFRWYEKFFTTESIVSGLKTSLVIGLVAAGAATLVGVLAAVGIARTRRFRPFLLSLFLSPLMVPAVVVGFSLLIFFSALDLRGGFMRICAGHLLITLPYTVP